MPTKQDIIDAIKQTAKENSGKPLGAGRFAKETGIKPYDWKKYWARFGDAQLESGYEPNTLQKPHNEEFIIKKLIGLIRKLNRFPTHGELRIERNNDSEFPTSKSLFETKLQKVDLAQKIINWCNGKSKFNDIVSLCLPVIEKKVSNADSRKHVGEFIIGEVYLFKSGRYYKIGKTNDTVRRGQELRVQLPEKIDLIHSIKTDDPSGVETYWHRRFESKRMQGEWFDLSAEDIKAFKRWRRIT